VIVTPVLVDVPGSARDAAGRRRAVVQKESQEPPMNELIVLVMSSTAVTAVLAAVYVGRTIPVGKPGHWS
jgi:hypothetical protein